MKMSKVCLMILKMSIEDSGNTLNNSITKNRRVVDVLIENLNLPSVSIIDSIKINVSPIVGYAFLTTS